MFKVQLLIISSLLTQALMAQTPTVSMAEAIQTALAKNPKTQANALRLQASYESLRASKKSLFSPNVSLGYNESTDFKTDLTPGGAASVSINLFNGLSDYYRIRAQECNYERTEALYNSTSASVPNSNGQIATLVSNYFINVVYIRENVNFTQSNLKKLNALAAFAKTTEQKVNISNAIQTAQISLDELKSKLEIAESNFEFAVNDKVPAHLDSLIQTIQHIDIPIDPIKAADISLEKSPEILSSRLNIKCIKLLHKSTQGQVYGFRADLRAGVNTNFNGKNTPGATLSISKSIGLGNRPTLRSEENSIHAAELDLDGVIAEVRNTLKNNYTQLKSSINSANSYEQAYTQNSHQFDVLLNKGSYLTEEEVTIAIGSISSYQSLWQAMNFKLQEVINIKFQIQKSIGTLFEANNITL